MISKKKYDVNGVPTQSEYWDYVDGLLSTYITYDINAEEGENGETVYEEMPNTKTVYTLESAEPMRIKNQAYTYNPYDSNWGENAYYYVTEYYKPESETAPKLVAEKVADKINTVKLTFDATTIEGVQNVAYDIMRHGIKIARVTAEDAVDGMITYTDEYVKNGDYEYLFSLLTQTQTRAAKSL